MSAARRFGKGDDGAYIEGAGRVVRLLADDDVGARHQRFVLDVGSGQTVLIAHNHEIAPRVPLGLGDRIRFRGLYEWSERGGTVHWTHRDPQGIEPGGWLRFRRRDYC